MGHGLTAFLGAREIIQAADDWGQFASRMRMATESAAEYEQAQQRMAASANETFRSINETRESFILMNPVLRQMGLSLDESIDAIDTFSGLLVVNAASSERASSAQAALAKSLQTGRIESDAWQSIMAAMPSLVQTLAKSSGMAEAEIRRLGVSGKLSVETLTAALVDANAAVLDQVRQMPTTVGDALTNLHNSFTEYVGRTNDAVGATRFLASTIGVAGEHFDALANAALLVAGGIAGRYVAALGIAGVEKAKLLLQTRAATIAEIAHQQSVARSAALQAQAALSSNALAAARQREAAATAAAAAAQAKLTTASSLASGAMTVLGGTIGLTTTLVAAGAAAWLLWGNRAADATKKAADAADQHIEGVLSRLRELNADIGRSTRGQTDAAIGAGNEALKRNAAEAQVLAGRIEKIKAEIGIARDFGYSQQHIRSKNAELIEAEHKYQDVLSREREIQAHVAAARQQTARAGIEAVQNFIDTTVVGETRVARERAKLQAEFDRVMRDAGGFNPALPEHVAAQNALKEKLVELGKSGREAKTGLSEAEKAARDMIKAGVDLAGTLDATAAGYAGDFFQKWESLSAAYHAGKISLEELTTAQGRYLAQQPGIKAALDAEENAIEARTSALQTLVGTEAQRAASLEEANARAAEELATMGMTEEQLAAYTAAKYRAAAAADEQAAAELDVAAALLDQQQMLPEVAAQYRRLAAEKRRSAQANTEAAGLAIERANAEAAQAVNEEWQRSAGYVESAIYDAIVSGGVDGAEILKRTINSLVLQPMIRMVVQGGTNAMMGLLGGGGGAGGGSSGGGIGGIPGTGGMISNGLLALGSSSMLAGTAAGSFLGSMGGAMSAGFGGFSGSMSAAYASMQAGATASAAGYAIGAVMPYVAAIAAIATALGAFKGPTYHSGAAVMTGTDDSQTTLRHKDAVGNDTRVWGGFSETDARGGAAYADPLKELGKSVANTIEGTLSAFGVGQQVSVYTAFGADGDDKSRGAMRVYDAAGNLLGANSDQALRGAKYSKDPSKGFAEFADDAGRVIRDALVAADLPAWVDDVLTGLGDAPGIELVGTALGQIETLRTMGEQVGPMLALTAEQMAGLAPAAGGLEAVIATLSGYAEATLTDAERYAIAGAQLQAMRDRIADLGFTVPTTIEEFRALTDGIDITTDAGRELRVEMMGLAPAFAASQAAVLSLIGTTRDDLAKIIRDGLTGASTSEEVSARLEEAVLGGIQNAMAASVANQVADLMIAGIINPAIETLVMGGELNRVAMAAQFDATVAEIKARMQAFAEVMNDPAVQEALASVRGSVSGIASAFTPAAPAVRTVATATRSMASAASSAASATDRLRNAEEALRDAYGRRADELRATIDQFDDFSRSLREFRESLYIGADSPLSLSARTAEAERQFRAVGAQARLGDLDAMGRLSAVGTDYLAAQRDSAASALDYARAVALVSGTAAAAEGTAQRQADVAREQLSLLDRTVSALIKIDDSVLSVEQAIRDYLAVDKGGAARLRAAGIPGYASGGHHVGGLRIVGERGPELEATGPARIWSADQTRKLVAGDGDLLAELQALRREVAALRAESAATARHTHATSRTLERVTRGGRAMQVVEDAA